MTRMNTFINKWTITYDLRNAYFYAKGTKFSFQADNSLQKK